MRAQSAASERGLCPRNCPGGRFGRGAQPPSEHDLGEASEGAVEAPSEDA
jgi:hypothetical protein